MRWYLHVDMDAFFASVEQVLDPSLRGKAIIVGGRNGRGVVTSASYEARRFGVRSAMPGFRAKQLCPHGVFLPNRRRVYADFSRRVFEILEQYSPDVHALSIDEGVVDLTGTERLFGPPLKTADRILQQIENQLGLPSSAGLAGTRVTAKIAATLAKPQGLIYVPHGSEVDFLAPLAVEIIPGVGPKTQKELFRRGILSIGTLLQHANLSARYLDFAQPQEQHHRHEHSVGNETTLDTPLDEITKMEEVLWELVEEVGARLRKDELYARCLTLKLRYTNFQTITRSRTLAAPTCFDREIFAVVSELLNRNLLPRKSVRLLGVSASALQTAGWQEPLFERERRASWEHLYRGIDTLRLKYGDAAIGSASPRQRSG